MSLPTRSGRGVGSLFIRHPLAGSTLLEVLITLAIMALVMAGVLGALAVVTSAVGDSRAVMEMTDRLRSAQQRLRQDLAGITAPGLPWLRPEAGVGYLEIIEGPIRDTDYTPEVNGNAATLTNLNDRPRDVTKGDVDDIIMFTTRSQTEPFVGRFGNTTVESPVAEVVWFASWDPATDVNPNDGSALKGRPFLTTDSAPPNILASNLSPSFPPLKLYRRVFLVMPELGVIGEQTFNAAGTAVTSSTGLVPDPVTGVFPHDISVRRVVRQPSPLIIQWVANSLGDLTKPQNRTAHAGNLSFPLDTTTAVRASTGANPDPVPMPNTPSTTTAPIAFALATNRLVPFKMPDTTPGGVGAIDPSSRYGEDLVMTNVLGFDVKVWDPLAPVYVVTGPVGTAGTDELRDRTPKLLRAGTTIAPGDPGYERMLELSLAGTPRLPDARGAFVDLYYSYFPNNTGTGSADLTSLTSRNLFACEPTVDTNPASAVNRGQQPRWSIFAGPGFFVSRQAAVPDTYLPPAAAGTVPHTATYDTWSMHYEFPGALYSAAASPTLVIADGRGTNGADDAIGVVPGTVIPADGVIDDIGERVSSPPYPVPLRGIQIKLRVYEPDSRTVREVTVVESLMQE